VAIFPEDQITDRSERFFAAELLREQLTRRYHGELPYAVTVEIERSRRMGPLPIGAVVWVERENSAPSCSARAARR
jgi:GTPase